MGREQPLRGHRRCGSLGMSPDRFADRDEGSLDLLARAGQIPSVLDVEVNDPLIGQAARGISGDMRARHPEVPWTQIVAHRNILVHNYASTDHEVVWRIASESVPALIDTVRPLLPR